MGRGVEGRVRQDKTVWRRGARQPSLHILLTRVACEVMRVAHIIQCVDNVDECMAPFVGCAQREPRKLAS